MSSPYERRYNQQQKETIYQTLQPFIPKDLLNIFASYSCIAPARYVFDEDAFRDLQYLPPEVDRLKYVSEHVHQAIFSSDDLPWIVNIEFVWLRYIFVLSPELSRLPLHTLVDYIEPTIEPSKKEYGEDRETLEWTPVRYDGRTFGHAVSLQTHLPPSGCINDERISNEVPFPIHAHLFGLFHCEYEQNDVTRPLISRRFYLNRYGHI